MLFSLRAPDVYFGGTQKRMYKAGVSKDFVGMRTISTNRNLDVYGKLPVGIIFGLDALWNKGLKVDQLQGNPLFFPLQNRDTPLEKVLNGTFDFKR